MGAPPNPPSYITDELAGALDTPTNWDPVSKEKSCTSDNLRPIPFW